MKQFVKNVKPKVRSRRINYINMIRAWYDMVEKTEYGTKRTIVLINKNDEVLNKLRASAMMTGKSYSFGKVLNSAILYALDKGFDKEKLIKLADEVF